MSAPCDLLIVGGGPAGLATALEARGRGLRAIVVDRGHPPLDKPCGEGLMPDGLERLRALGVELRGAGRPFRGIRYVDVTTDAPLVVDGAFPRGDEPACGLGLRRTTLHAALVERAEALGLDVRWRHRALGLETGASRRATDRVVLRVDDGESERRLEARVLVGADGLRSRVRAWAGLDLPEPPPATRRFGVRRHLAVAPWNDRVEVHWADGCEAYVTPVADDAVGVAILWSADWAPPGTSAGFDVLLGRFPRLAERLRDAESRSSDRGCGPLLQRARAATGERLALVGDASGYVDAITGEGLTLAFHHAHALARSLARAQTAHGLDDAAACRRALDRYARHHARIGRVPWALTRLLLALERRPSLRRLALAALAAEPSTFERFLAVHVGARAPAHLAGALPGLARGGARALAHRRAHRLLPAGPAPPLKRPR